MGRPSIINTILLYLSLIGIGVIGGYGLFYYLFSERCSGLIAAREDKHTTALNALQSNYDDAVQRQQQCEASKATLLDKHDENLGRLGKAHSAQETTVNTIAELREELTQTKYNLESMTRRLQESEKAKEIFETKITNEKESLQDELNIRYQQLRDLSANAKSCTRVLSPVQKELQHIKEYVRGQHHQRCLTDHGPGPFTVEFTLQFPATMEPEEGPTSFQVELSPLSDMPHAVTVFLDLVKLQLYDGTAFVAATDATVEGGSPSTAASDRSVELFEQYARIGHRQSPLAFNEYSSKSPHEMYTISFIGTPVAGPSLAFNMMNNTDEGGPDEDGLGAFPAFGRVTKGVETLQRVQSAPRAADGYRFALNVRIESVRLVEFSDDGKRDEL